MREKPRSYQVLCGVLLLIYFALLIRLLFFRTNHSLFALSGLPLRLRLIGANLIPFKTVLYYLGGNQSRGVVIDNLLGNIAAFGPMGFLLPLLFQRAKKIGGLLSIIILTSLSFEVLQLITGWGSFDVDDIILNTTGGILGFLIYKVLVLVIDRFRGITATPKN
jgi:glycopeptide antibiotics resistance protein